MEDKTYSQMWQEFVEFYYNDVNDKLPRYTYMRRIEGSLQLAFWGFFCSFSLIYAFILWNEFASKFVYTIFPSLKFLSIVVGVLWGFDVGVVVVSFIALLILSSMNSPGAVKSGGTRYIQQDLEMELKKDLMPKFVKIFFEDGSWYKKSMYKDVNSVQPYEKTETQEEYCKRYEEEGKRRRVYEQKFRIKNLRNLKIMNPYPRLNYDDAIIGSFRDISINIYEVDTKMLKFPEIFIICFLFIWFCGFTGGLLLLVFFCIILPLIILFLLIFSFKIFQYSKFRGVVIEFDMNKNFKGHTFFHEESLRAKKIPYNKNLYKKVDLESVSFENKYNVYSDDQIEARYLLTPSMMERIENLKFTFKAKYVRGAFKDNKLTLAIHTGKDMFAMGSDFKDSDSNTFQELYDEMISVLKIVDELKLNQHTGL